MNPGVENVELDKDYDLLLTIVEKPSELLHLQAIEGWERRCRVSICWIAEFYASEIPMSKSFLEVLSRFDHVVFMHAALEPFEKWVKGSISCLPAGVDALKFCPYPSPPVRAIDVFSLGRRAPATHQALLDMFEEEGGFYVYDTLIDLESYSLAEHRSLVANTIMRSRYFIANPGKIDNPEETGGQEEFGYRHFEGIAGGSILVGQRPKNCQFGKSFDWDDIVIDLPFDSEEIRQVIQELDRQPERQVRIRRSNMVQALLRHDWVYRWEQLLEIAGLSPMPALAERKRRLKERAALVEMADIEP